MSPAGAALAKGLFAVAACTAIAIAGVVVNADHAATARAAERLRITSEVEHDLQSQQQDVLGLRAQALAGDPAFVDYVTQSLVPNPQLGGGIDTLSISDLLKERRHGDDIAMLLDPTGEPVTSIGVISRGHALIRGDALVVRAISQLKPAQGMWLDNGDLLWVVVSPLLRGHSLQGLLVTASRVGDSFVAKLGRLSHSDVALVVDPAARTPVPYSSGLDIRLTDLLAARRADIFAVTAEQGAGLDLHDGSQSARAWVTPIHLEGGHAALVALDQQVSLGRAMGEDTTHLVIGVLCFALLAIGAVVWQWRRTWQPLAELAHAFDTNKSAVARVRGSAAVRDVRDRLELALKAARKPA